MTDATGHLEPESAAFLNGLKASRAQTSSSTHPDLATVRQSMAALLEACGPRRLPVGDTRRELIALTDREIPVHIYWPEDEDTNARAGQLRPMLLYFHGGGWTHFSAKTHDNVARYLCTRADCIVINVDYRLSPEHKFPDALEDAYETLRWAHSNARRLKGDSGAIVAAGESAGGTMSIALCLLAKDRGGPSIALHIPMCPSLTLHEYDRYPSWKRLGGGDYLLSEAALEEVKRAYLRDPAEAGNPLASPILAPDLSGLPPAFIITAEFDPLVDEGAHYARRLRDSGVPAELSCFAGTIHCFMILAGAISLGYRALDQAAERIRSL